jgi:hypothetical protein
MQADCGHLMMFSEGDLSIDIDDDIDERVAEEKVVKETAFDIAERVAAIARETAPHMSGDYAAGIEAQVTKTGARVYADDYKSAWIEFGIPSRGQPAHWILRRAAEAAGLKFKKKRG